MTKIKEVTMIGMSFSPFLALLALGFIGSFVLHVLVRYRALAGLDGFMCKWIAGWIGAWLGSPVFGYWGIHLENVYIVPAVLGAFAAPFLLATVFRVLARTTAATLRLDTAPTQPNAAPQIEMRRAS